jgi:hypothetical protein
VYDTNTISSRTCSLAVCCLLRRGSRVHSKRLLHSRAHVPPRQRM